MSHPSQSEERLPNVPPRHRGMTGELVNTSVPRQISIGSQRDVIPRNAPALPPLTALTSEVDTSREQGNSGSPNLYRPLGVRNILNPASEAQSVPSQTVPQSPQRGAITGQYVGHAVPSTSPHIRKRGEPHSPAVEPQFHTGRRPERRILTPRSPRAASLGRSPSSGPGLINRVPLPSGERVWTIEPGESGDATVPPLPPLPSTRGGLAGIQSRDNIGTPMHAPGAIASFPIASPRSQQQEGRQDPVRPPYAGGEASPSSFPQSQGQMQQTLPQANYMSSAPGPVRSGIQYGQPEYQLTIETTQGPVVVPVNVDYQQASRLADEKRKRNAGASARFRARRKEKEREANQTIAGLQQELQDLLDEREYYRSERNFFRDMLARNNHGKLPARPPSPGIRKPNTGPPSAVERSPSVEFGRMPGDMPVSQRRRTGDYPPSLTSQSPSTPYNPAFPAGPSMTLPAPTGSSSYSDPRTGPAGPPPPTSRPPPQYDPLRRSIHDRDWTAGR